MIHTSTTQQQPELAMTAREIAILIIAAVFAALGIVGIHKTVNHYYAAQEMRQEVK
jgi:hypothetical protein